MHFYCQFTGQFAVETFYLISRGLSEVKTVFFFFFCSYSHQSWVFLQWSTYHLFRGPQRYLNRHNGSGATRIFVRGGGGADTFL